MKWFSTTTLVPLWIILSTGLSFGETGGVLPLPPAAAPTNEQDKEFKVTAPVQTRDAYQNSSQLGTQLSSPDVRLDNPEVTQSINNARVNQALTEQEIQRKVKNKEITKKQGEELRAANALAAMAGFNQGAGAAAGSDGKSRKNSKRPSQRATGSADSEAPGSGPTDSYSPSYTTPEPYALDRGPERTNRVTVPPGGDIADTSLQGLSSPPPASQSGLGLVSSGGSGRIGENESRTNGSESINPEGRDERTATTNGGAVAGVGTATPGAEATPGAPEGLDKLDELLLKTAIQVKQRLNKQAKDGKGTGATADRGLASVQDGSANTSGGTYAGSATAKPPAIGMADLFGSDAPMESGSSLSAKRIARDLAAKLDETSEELVGSKLAVWFLLFFIFGFGVFLFIRRRAK